MRNTTGLWVYRLAFVLLTALAVALLNFVFQARFDWFPSYEEKLLAQMKKIEDSLQPPRREKGSRRDKKKLRRTVYATSVFKVLG